VNTLSCFSRLNLCLFVSLEKAIRLMSNPAADALASKASQKELGGDLDDAFSLYVQATQSYLHLSRTATSPHLRDQHKASATRCLERAERIKATKRDVTPVQRDRFSKGVW
jgi:calpain-7